MDEDIRTLILDVTEASLEAQLRAVRRLRSTEGEPSPAPKKSMSNLEMVRDVLRANGNPLHISVIRQQIQERFGAELDRESLVSSLSKKVARRDRFVRTGRNTFGLIEE
jgi:hypothetical protein